VNNKLFALAIVAISTIGCGDTVKRTIVEEYYDDGGAVVTDADGGTDPVTPTNDVVTDDEEVPGTDSEEPTDPTDPVAPMPEPGVDPVTPTDTTPVVDTGSGTPTTPVVTDTPDTGTVTPPVTPTAPTYVAPLLKPKFGLMLLAMRYTRSVAFPNGSPCAQLRGDLPGMDWTKGPKVVDTDGDGYYEYRYMSDASTGFKTDDVQSRNYRFTYVAVNCDTNEDLTGTSADWALYGVKKVLNALTSAQRAPIECAKADCSAPEGCNLALDFDVISSLANDDGNMATATSCTTP